MIRNTASQTISARLNALTDGSAVTTGTTTVFVTIDGGTQATGAGTVTHEGNGEWSYVPTQAETNGVQVSFMFTNSLAVGQLINVYTRPSGTGFPAVDASNRVDVGLIRGQVLTLSGNVVTFPFGWNIAPTTISTVGLRVTGGAAADAVRFVGGAYDAGPDTAGKALFLSSSNIALHAYISSNVLGDTPAIKSEAHATSSVDTVLGRDFINAAGIGAAAIELDAFATGAINNAVLAAGTIGASTIAASALNGKGDWNIGKTGYALTAGTGLGNQTSNITGTITTTTNLTNAPPDSSGVTTLLARIGAFTGTGVNTILGFLRAVMSKTATLPSDVGGTFAATADSLEAIRDQGDAAWITGSGGGGLAGPSSVTITFLDGASAPIGPIQLTVVGQGSTTSTVAGIAAFGLSDGTYTVTAAPKNGILFPDSTLVVSGTTTLTITGAAPSIPAPSSPSGCTVAIRARTQQLVPQVGVTIGFRYISIPSSTGMALPVNPLLLTTDSNGDVTAQLLRGATVKYWRGKEPALANSTNTFTVPAASTYSLPDLLGEDAT